MSVYFLGVVKLEVPGSKATPQTFMIRAWRPGVVELKRKLLFIFISTFMKGLKEHDEDSTLVRSSYVMA